MAKLTHDDKMRIQTLREQGMGAKAIKSAYPTKNWSLSTLKKICRRIDMTRSVVDRKMGSGRPKSSRSAKNIAKVQQLICSQEDEPGTSKNTRQVAAEVGISRRSVGRIAKHDLQLSSFKRMPVQLITDARKTQETNALPEAPATTFDNTDGKDSVFHGREDLLRKSAFEKPKTIVSGQMVENVMLIHDSSWSNEPSSRHTSWYLQELVLWRYGKACTSCQKR